MGLHAAAAFSLLIVGIQQMSELADFTFNNPAPWDDEQAIGPAMRIPPAFLGFKLTDKIWVEFLYVGPNKNHVVFRVTFETKQFVDDVWYFGARISMDLADVSFEVLNDEEVSFIFRLSPLVG